MSLFATPAPTQEQITANVVQQVIGSAKQTLELVDRAHRMGLAFIWANPQVTAEQFFAAAGPKGGLLVAGSVATAEYLYAQYSTAGQSYTPPSLPSGVSLTVAEDGTVTVVRPAPPAE